MMNVQELHRQANEGFNDRVQSIGDDQWHAPTPSGEWDVRDLVNHVVNETLWTPPLLAGRTIDEIGDRFEGDILGDDPKVAWKDASAEVTSAVRDLEARTARSTSPAATPRPASTSIN